MGPDALYTRQQVSELIGEPDTVLTFWLRNDLLKPVSGGEGKGSHRKFDLFQVNIAAVLAELRRFGVNVGVMRSLAVTLQYGAALAATAECNPFAFEEAIELREELERFRAGEEIRILSDPDAVYQQRLAYHTERALTGRDPKWIEPVMRPAESEAEVLTAREREGDFHDEFCKVLAFARRLAPTDYLPLRLFVDLHHGAYRYVFDGALSNYWGDYEWVVVPKADGDLQIFRGPEGNELLGGATGTVRSGLYLSPGAIFRSVWEGRLQPCLIHAVPRSPEKQAMWDAIMEAGAAAKARRDRRQATA